jgi:nucleotide-binding universal stress UspA family protein
VKRLLIASDLSSRSDIAIRRGFKLARQHGAAAILLHVVDDDRPRRLLREEIQRARKFLDDYYGRHDGAHAFKLSIRVEPGMSFEVISRVAEAEDADLLVMGACRRRLLLDVVVGTTLERVVRSSRRPVLMASLPPRHRHRSVLAAIDLSEGSRQALLCALRLGFLDDAAVSVVHAFTAPGRGRMTLGGLDPGPIKDHVDECLADREGLLDAFLARPELAGLDAARYVEDAAPFVAIERVAARVAAELVVVGTRGVGTLGRLFLGSVTEEVLRRVECDVLAVPPRPES